MDKVNILRRYGLFDAKVPRYTSYPPANRFQPDVGARKQQMWLAGLDPEEAVSVYVHIPFCRRLCWFCACRTQGTSTLGPVAGYMDDVAREVAAIYDLVGHRLPMARLHLGGGTPTLLSADLMEAHLDQIDTAFARTLDFEFSVEIDPTEAAPEVLDLLSARGLGRASIGVQDFDRKVQDAIGRHQSFEQTEAVVKRLRAGGVRSLNIDLLYGLPFQTQESLIATLNQVIALHPDRLALYGYAHVPHVSKRQVMIPAHALPNPEQRYLLAEHAKELLLDAGYIACGIDHYALPSDSLAVARTAGKLRRNFQGYTDDPCDTLIGIGASAISKFRQGYSQNAVATSAYRGRISEGGFAGHKGYALSPEDDCISAVIEAIMCHGRLYRADIAMRYPNQIDLIDHLIESVTRTFPQAVTLSDDELSVNTGLEAIARVLAAHIDTQIEAHHIHSLAI